MRQIILDTETTGLNPRSGDRIIEIGCVEMVNRRLTGNNFHYYINPERDSDPGALAVHGLTTEFLSDKPKFADIANTLCEFVSDAEIIIHNAPFDVGFLDAEFERVGKSNFAAQVRQVIDTLVQAKRALPRQTEFTRRTVRALRCLECTPHAAWRLARCGATGRGVSRHDPWSR